MKYTLANPVIPEPLKSEFATVEALWALPVADTRYVDALILTWVKYEKQTRRLFSFLVLQHPAFSAHAKNSALEAIVNNRQLYPHRFLWGIEAIANRSLLDLMGDSHTELSPHVLRIKGYRDKIFHGQLTGQRLTASELLADTGWLIEWMAALADAGMGAFGYDGLERNTRCLAEARPAQVTSYPFATPDEFLAWLRRVSSAQTSLLAPPHR